MQIGLTDDVYEVMGQWQIDEKSENRSVLIPPFRPQIDPPRSPMMPQGRPRIDRRPPIPWQKWARAIIPPKLKAISPNPVDQMPLNPVCYTLPMPMPIAVKVHLDGSRPWFKGDWLDGVRVLGSGRLPQTVEAFPFGLPSAKAKVP